MSIVLQSTGGGSVTLQEPSTASTFTQTLPSGTGTVVVSGINSAITAGTAVSASGTSVDFTGIPSWVKRITVMFSGASVSGTSVVQVQLGSSGSVETTGYSTMIGLITTTNNTTRGVTYSSGFATTSSGAASDTWRGNIVFTLVGSNIWTGTGIFYNGTDGIVMSSGTKTTSATLDRVRITTVNGTDTFDAGTINILYE